MLSTVAGLPAEDAAGHTWLPSLSSLLQLLTITTACLPHWQQGRTAGISSAISKVSPTWSFMLTSSFSVPIILQSHNKSSQHAGRVCRLLGQSALRRQGIARLAADAAYLQTTAQHAAKPSRPSSGTRFDAACTMLAPTRETVLKLSPSGSSTSDLTDLCWLQGPSASRPAVYQSGLRESVKRIACCRQQPAAITSPTQAL